MEEWKTYKYTELATLIGGGTPKTTEPSYWGGTIPWLSVKDFCGGSKYVYKTEKTITESGLANSSTKLLEPKDIIISARGTVGELAMIPFSMAFNQSCFGIRANKELIDSDYLYYLTQTKVRELRNSSHGSVFDTITRDTFDKIVCHIPNIAEQIHIASILSTIDAKIELNRRINDNLEQQAQAAFDKLLEISATYGEGVQLSQYAEVNPTRKLHKGQIARCIDMSCLPTRGSFPSDWSFKPYEGGMKFINGDTIMARITPCLENGKTAYINFLDSGETAFGSTEYIVLHPRQGYAPEMLYFLSRNTDFVSYAVSHMNGSSGRQRVAGDDIAKYELPRFQDDDLSEFNAVAIPNMKIILNNSLQNRELVNLRDALLPKLMSGELKPDLLNL